MPREHWSPALNSRRGGRAPMSDREPTGLQSPVKSTKVLDFQTAADVAKAEEEGEVV